MIFKRNRAQLTYAQLICVHITEYFRRTEFVYGFMFFHILRESWNRFCSCLASGDEWKMLILTFVARIGRDFNSKMPQLWQ